MAPRTGTAERQRAQHLGPERRRPQVLDTALRLAVRDGLAAVTFGAIANELGVTRSVVYACFDDRVAMLGELLDREQAALAAGVLGALHASGVDNEPEQAFVDGFTALFAAVLERPDAWRLMLGSSPDPALSARVADSRAEMILHATTWIGPAMQRWWGTPDLERKLPVLIELFVGSCESGIRVLLDEDRDWEPADLAAFVAGAVHRVFAGA